MPSSPKKKGKTSICRVAVLGSGTVQDNSSVYRQAMALGRGLAEEGITVYHGGYGGVMEAVARGVREKGGHNVGVTVKRSLARLNSWADAEIRAFSWQERLFTLMDKADAYVFLDGATGTLNELFFVWEMANKKLHQKPIVILGDRLRRLVRALRKDPSLRIPRYFYEVTSLEKAIHCLKALP